MAPILFIPVFGGQGTMTFHSSEAISVLTRTASGKFLLDSCFSAFHAEIASLESRLAAMLDICASHFKDPCSIIHPPYDIYITNPALSMPALVLMQTLLYLSYVEDNPTTTYALAPTSFMDILHNNAKCDVGVVGFSSGILSACVVATSTSPHMFVCHAVEAYRLALRIGIQSQIYRAQILQPGHHDSRPWGLVLIGISKNLLQQLVHEFNEGAGKDLVTITAVMSDRHMTVSGHPEHLATFLPVLPGDVSVQETKLTTLYHSPSQLRTVRDNVLLDVVHRKIKFPEKPDIIVPIRSTFTGDLILSAVPPESLVHLVIDMVLTQPVNWDLLVRKTTANIPPGMTINLLNIGVGTSLIREFKNSIHSPQSLSVSDLVQCRSKLLPIVKREPIAIIGMAANMPGAPNVDALWELLETGQDTLREIPEDRFIVADYVDRSTPGRRMKASAANLVENLDQFDHKFFNVSPREAKSMDPQQRILLQTGYEALENAGYVPNGSPTFDPATFGCYIGAATGDYVQNLRGSIDVYYSTGNLRAFLSGRLSYCLGLGGPSIVLDTACSSSAVAIHQACRALINRDCNAALAGGVNAISSPDMFIGLDRGHFLSPSGRCKPFDASADGYSRGEGCGIFVLKRLQDALSENDHILGIIRGVEVNQSANAVSITHPHAQTQMNLFKQLLVNSGVDPNAVNVVEAHGTGTQAGDTIELQSIRGVLAVDRAVDNPLYVTSIKANIGHLEAASGCASLVKILMMFQRRLIPQQIFLNKINPRIRDLNLDNTIISTENIPWSVPNGRTSRIALINNFGAAGSNSAMLVEEYFPEDKDGCGHHADADGASLVFGLSAKDIPSLEILRSKYVSWLQNSSGQLNLLNVAYTATARRQLYPYRLAVSASTVHRLIQQLQIAPITIAAEAEKGVIFVFSGQGGQYYGMGRNLYLSSMLFKHHIDECDFILKSHGFSGIIDVIGNSDPSLSSANEDQEQMQSAAFCLQYALARLWISWGIRPQAVVGHSLGEYVALVIAGVMTLKDGLLFVARRARLMSERCTRMTTGMAAVSLGSVKLESILHSNKNFYNISISCYNSEGDCVVSGPLRELEQFEEYIDTKAIAKVTRLRVPFGYHSATMLPLVEDLKDLSMKTKTRPPQIPFISTALGRVILQGDLTFPSQDYLARQCVEPVRFAEGVKSYLTAFPSGTTMTWIEISPHPTIIPMLRCFPALTGSAILGCLRISEEPWSTMSKSLASMYRDNHRLDWGNVFNSLGRHVCISLPSYPFSTQRFWTPFVEEACQLPYDPESAQGSPVHHRLRILDDREDKLVIFQTSVSQIKRYIEGHRVGNTPLCPASVYLELVYSAVRLAIQLKQGEIVDCVITLQEIKFPKPLTLNPGAVDDLILTVEVDIKKSTFALKSRTSLLDHESINANGRYSVRSRDDTERSFARSLLSVTHRIDAVICPDTRQQLETFSARTMYQVIFSRIVEYSSEFQTIQALSMHSNGLEATATMIFSEPDSSDNDNFIVHPLFVDTLIHIAGFISNIHASQNDAYICNEVESVRMLPPAIKANTSYRLYCKIVPMEDQAYMVGESYAILDDPEGSNIIVAHVYGIRFRRVRLSSFLSGLEHNTKLGLGTGTVNKGRPLPFDVGEIVMKIVADACKVNVVELALDQELEVLGVDSLMRIELAYDISKAFPGFGCRPKEIAICRVICDIVNAIMSNESSKYAGGLSSVGLPATPPSIFSTPRTMVQSPTSMRQIVARVLDVEEDIIKDDIPLSSLGLDSLSTLETMHALSQELHLKIPGNLLSGNDTIRDLEAQVSNLEPSLLPDAFGKQAGRGRSLSNAFHESLLAVRFKSLTLLQNTMSSRTPLVLIHDGSGLTISYERISPLNRRVWGITNPNFASDEQWTTLEQMAESYTNLIENEMEGPVILGGWSFGGVVAFEIATQLSSRSFPVQGVILLDSPSPYNHVPLSSSLIDRVLDAAGNTEPTFRNFCKTQFFRNAKLLSEYKPSRSHYDLPLFFLKSNESYSLPDNPDDIAVPSWLSDRNEPSSIVEGWQNIVDTPINILDIPGHHFQAFESKNVLETSHRIFEACNYLDNMTIG